MSTFAKCLLTLHRNTIKSSQVCSNNVGAKLRNMLIIRGPEKIIIFVQKISNLCFHCLYFICLHLIFLPISTAQRNYFKSYIFRYD